jgi:SAM-dependent methyltransferase
VPALLTSTIIAMSKRLSRRGLYEFLADEYAALPANGEVLSVGAGGEVNKLLGDFAKRIGFSVVSFDIDAKRQPDIQGDICTHDFGARQFDAVVLSEVLEHVHWPHLALENIRKALKPDGKLILTVPFMLPMHDRPYDFYRFTRYGLEFLLRDYSNVAIRERNSYYEAIDVFYARLLQSGSRRARILAYFVIPIVYVRAPFMRLLAKIAPTDAMTTGYVVTARKAA